MLAGVEKLLSWRKGPQEPHEEFQKSRVGGQVSEVLQSEVFGEKQFNMFVDQMIRLTKNPKERGLAGRIIDKEEKK